MLKFITLSCFIFILSCGYHVVGYEDVDNVNVKKYIIDEIKNSYFESGYKILLEDEINSYFYENSMLTEKGEGNYRVIFDLKSSATSSNIISISSQAVSSDLTVVLYIKVLSIEGKVIYEKIFTDINSFSLGGNLSTNITNRDNAFRQSVRDIVRDFKYEFEISNL